MAANALEAIRDAGTKVIADTADFDDIKRFRPSEGTTNPSLILAAAKLPQYKHFFSATKEHIETTKETESVKLTWAVEFLAVEFGAEIWRLTGRVSTEIDVALSFDTEGTVAAALRVLRLSEAKGVLKEGVRIKIAATWKGVQAAKILEHKHSGSVLITVVFGLAQAKLAAEAGVTAIAPYVGRIGDWHKAHGQTGSDVGVEKVQAIQKLFRAKAYKTQIMGASFRNTEQCKQLSGLDMLTIAPALLRALQDENGVHSNEDVIASLVNGACDEDDVDVSSESAFRWTVNSDACAVEKSAEAIRRFANDTDQLKRMLAELE